MHPAPSTCLFDEIGADDILEPGSCLRIPQVDDTQLNADALQYVGLAIRFLEEIAIVCGYLKLMLPNKISSDVRDHRIDIHKWSDTILSPLLSALVPIWVMVLIKLPVPE